MPDGQLAKLERANLEPLGKPPYKCLAPHAPWGNWRGTALHLVKETNDAGQTRATPQDND